jgi:hypothetical protein
MPSNIGDTKPVDLLKINVNDHTEKKGQLTYLSWAWAWAEVLKVDPQATWVVHTYGPQGAEQPCMWIGETAMVHTSVTILGLRRECMLPVMDHKNNALKSPDARRISDAIMRCMTKAISMHGLGLYIYAGEDLPEAEQSESHLAKQLKASIEAEKTKKALQAVGVIKATAGAGNGLTEERKQVIEDVALHLVDCHTAGKDMDAARVWYANDTFVDNDEKVYCWSLLATESKLRAMLKANRPVGHTEWAKA